MRNPGNSTVARPHLSSAAIVADIAMILFNIICYLVPILVVIRLSEKTTAIADT